MSENSELSYVFIFEFCQSLCCNNLVKFVFDAMVVHCIQLRVVVRLRVIYNIVSSLDLLILTLAWFVL